MAGNAYSQASGVKNARSAANAHRKRRGGVGSHSLPAARRATAAPGGWRCALRPLRSSRASLGGNCLSKGGLILNSITRHFDTAVHLVARGTKTYP